MTEGMRIKSSDIFTFLLRLIELLRPRFYNRITWLIVISGIAMMSTQIWEIILDAVLKRQFDISISCSNDAAWGFALCMLGLVYHTANTRLYELSQNIVFRARKQQEVLHDKEIFSEVNEIMPEEQVVDFINNLINDHSYYSHEAARITLFARFLATTGSQFLTQPLSERARDFIKTSDELSEFLTYKFFVFPEGQIEPNMRHCMVPGLNMDREGDGSPEQSQQYDALTNELEALSSKFMQHYRALRASVKSALVI